jgi:TonB family protein
MRRILAASLLLSPLAFTAVAAASAPANDTSAPALVRPVSTGVTSPKLVYSTHVIIPENELALLRPNDTKVVLKLNVDQTGKTSDIRVLKSVNQDVDARVVDAVRQFRWSPATLDYQTIPMEMNLEVVVQR